MLFDSLTTVVPYEQQLDDNFRWALKEGSRHFEGQSKVQLALQTAARRMDELHIPYALAGALALFRHGYRRFTEDVDLLVTPDGFKRIDAERERLGWISPSAGGKNLRDRDTGVRIELLVSGDYPGDGKPKPIAFPDPQAVAVETGGIPVVSLPRLAELKLASGLTGHGRRKDLSDVQEVIKALKLPLDFALELDAYVRPIYIELWREVEEGRAMEAAGESPA